MKTNNYAGIDPHIVAVIEREARKLIGRYGLTASDVPDIEQDLHLKVWSALKEVDNAIFEAAVHRIVRNATIDYLRWRERECRDWRREKLSLDDFAADADEPEETLGSVLDLAPALQAALGSPSPWADRRWEDADFKDAMERLPGELRDLADTLDACGGNLSEAARMLGVTRKKARVLLDRLRLEFDWLRRQ